MRRLIGIFHRVQEQANSDESDKESDRGVAAVCVSPGRESIKPGDGPDEPQRSNAKRETPSRRTPCAAQNELQTSSRNRRQSLHTD